MSERLSAIIEFGNKRLIIPEDITSVESANLSVALTLASQGLLAGKEQRLADNLIKDLNLERLFVQK